MLGVELDVEHEVAVHVGVAGGEGDAGGGRAGESGGDRVGRGVDPADGAAEVYVSLERQAVGDSRRMRQSPVS